MKFPAVLSLVVLSRTFDSSTAFVPNASLLRTTTTTPSSRIFPNRCSHFTAQTQTKQSKFSSRLNSQDGNSDFDINGSADVSTIGSANANGSGRNVYKSDLSIEELRYIATSKGYDTIGMDRRGLEMIAYNWTAREDSELKSRDAIMVPYSYDRYETETSSTRMPTNTNTSPQLTATYSRRDSFKASLVGFFTGAIAVSPVTYLHTYTFPSEIIANELSQFLFDTFTGGISAGAFATIYRYFISPPSPTGGEKDESFSNAIVGAFVLAKSFSRIRVSYYCEGLYCGEPLGFMDWTMLQQFSLSCLENLALFGAVAITLEYACFKDWVSYPKNNIVNNNDDVNNNDVKN